MRVECEMLPKHLQRRIAADEQVLWCGKGRPMKNRGEVKVESGIENGLCGAGAVFAVLPYYDKQG